MMPFKQRGATRDCYSKIWNDLEATMAVGKKLVLRKWDFDIDLQSLGPVRCAYFDPAKKYKEHRESIEAGEGDAEVIAREIFAEIARVRTGDETSDAKLEGRTFSSAEIAGLSRQELDQFCDALLEGRLHGNAPAHRVDGVPEDAREGVGGLLAAIRDSWTRKLAERAQTIEIARKASTAGIDIASIKGSKAMADYSKVVRPRFDVSHLVGSASMDHIKDILGPSREVSEFFRQEGLAKEAFGPKPKYVAMSGAIDHNLLGVINSALNPASGAFQKIVDEQQRARQRIYGAIGGSSVGDAMKSLELGALSSNFGGVLDPTASAIGAALTESKRSLIDEAVGSMASSQQDLFGKFAFEQIPRLAADATTGEIASPALQAFHVDLPRMPDFEPPMKRTNEILKDMHGHMKLDSAEAKAEAIPQKQAERKGLRYTAGGFWTAIFALVVSVILFLWQRSEAQDSAREAKADAIETAKKTAAQDEARVAEIRALVESNREERKAFQATLRAERMRRTTGKVSK